MSEANVIEFKDSENCKKMIKLLQELYPDSTSHFTSDTILVVGRNKAIDADKFKEFCAKWCIEVAPEDGEEILNDFLEAIV